MQSSLIPPKVLSLLLRCSRDQLAIARAISERTQSLLRLAYVAHKESLETSLSQRRTLPEQELSDPTEFPGRFEVSQKRLSKVSRIGSRKKFLHSPNARSNSRRHRGSHS